MRVAFAGTPEFASAPLRALLDAGIEVVGVLSQPDRPAGRGRKLTPSPVRQVALEHGLPWATPANLKTEENRQALRDWQPDLLIVIAYGLLLPREVLDLPRLGCVNVHASLLPRWRGAAPIQRAIEAGDAKSGLCLMQMDAGLDTGPVLAQTTLPIASTMTGGELHDALLAQSCIALPDWVRQLANNELSAQAQPETGVTYAHKLSKAEAQLAFREPAETLARKIRAFDPWPVAHVEHGGEALRLLGGAQAISANVSDAAGTILEVNDAGAQIATGQGVVLIPQMQWPGRRRVAARDALNSRKLTVGDCLGC